MRRIMCKWVLVMALVCGSKLALSQSIGYYPFNSILSVSTNPENNFWVDFRFQTNSYFSSLSTEVAPQINLNKNPTARFYVGGGLRANPFASLADKNSEILEGYFLNFGVRSAILNKIPKLQFAFEISPFVASDFESGIFRTRLGLAYNFSGKN